MFFLIFSFGVEGMSSLQDNLDDQDSLGAPSPPQTNITTLPDEIVELILAGVKEERDRRNVALAASNFHRVLHPNRTSSAKGVTLHIDRMYHPQSYQVTPSSVRVALSALFKRFPDIQSLHVVGLQHVDVATRKMFFQEVKVFRRLSVFDLSHNELGNYGMPMLSEALPFFPNLSVLSLRKNCIEAPGFSCLASGINACGNLQNLDVSENKFGVTGMLVLARTLFPLMQKLESLNLESTALGRKGARTLARNLKYLPRLQNLAIGDNNLSVVGTSPFIAPLKAIVDRLLRLDLTRNRITSAFLHRLRRLLPQTSVTFVV